MIYIYITSALFVYAHLLTGLTVLRKQAELSTASDPLYLSSSSQRPLDSAPSSPTHNSATPRTKSSMDFFSPFPPRNSISLKNIRLNSRVFNLERWSSPNEFDNLVPAHFKASAQTSHEGLDMLESLLHDTGTCELRCIISYCVHQHFFFFYLLRPSP